MEERITEALLEGKLIDKDQLKEIQEEKKYTNDRLIAIISRLGFVPEGKLLAFLSNLYRIEVIDLDTTVISPEVVKVISSEMAYRYEAVPVERRGKILLVAMVDPGDLVAIEDMRFATGLEVKPLLASERAVREALDTYYGMSKDVSEVKEEEGIAKELGVEDLEILEAWGEVEDESVAELEASASGGPVIKLVNFYIADAVHKGASDIHIEPFEKQVRVRFRVDGVLREQSPPPYNLKSGLITRVKLMSKMDIAERRKPQDGRINIKVDEKKIDIRVSVVPCLYGEKVVMRILDKSALMLDLGILGFEDEDLKKYLKAIESPYGIILITGPTGSGKTTTLYSTLSRLNTPERQILTVEDPVEYNIEGLNQVQIHEEIGLTFAAALRAFLRQSPNVILVGEIRDNETAEIAIRAALTGHLVFSTIHTNDAPTTIDRIVDLGIPPYLVSASVVLIQAQRLVRKICKHCKEQIDADPNLLAEAGIPVEALDDGKVFQGKGCSRCGYTGYKGRIALFEVMPVSATMREMILNRATSDQISKLAKEEGMKNLREDAIIKIKKGITTVEEAMRETSSL